jgi:hypothetical protein
MVSLKQKHEKITPVVPVVRVRRVRRANFAAEDIRELCKLNSGFA